MGSRGDEGGKNSSFPHMGQTRTTPQPVDQTVAFDFLSLVARQFLPQVDPPLTEQS